MDRGQLVRLAAAWGIAVAVTVGVGASSTGAATQPTVKLPTTVAKKVEGNAGTSTVTLTATLSQAPTSTVTVTYATFDGTAKVADGDYAGALGTLTFAPGVVSRPITVAVKGDTKLEDYELFKVKLLSATGASIGNAAQQVQILNDEKPKLAVTGVKVSEGQPAVLKLKLVQRYYQSLTVSASTVDGTAVAPADYGSVSRSVTFAAGTKGPIGVSATTVDDRITESNETFSLRASGTGVVAPASGKATLTDPPVCPAGTSPTTPMPAAPYSPSSPPMLGPPSTVTGGTAWDMVFQDEFDSSAYTASRWSTGMRSGAMTLEGNTELQWYVPGNSVVTTDQDGSSTVSVLQQRLTKAVVPGEYYTVRTLSRIYPPSVCPAYYDPNVNNSTSSSNTNPTRTPYQFTSGMLNSAKSFGFRYGYVETRVKMPKGFALWPALWLRDWNGWSYEIDALEGFDRDARVFRSVYWGGGQSLGTNNDGGDLGVTATGPCRATPPLAATSSSASTCSLANALDLSAGYHTIGLNWTPTRYEIYLDGVLRWTSPAGADVASDYNHLILNLAFGNSTYEFDWTKEPVKPFDPGLFDTSWFPKRTVEWDYVRVWQAPGARDVCTTGSC